LADQLETLIISDGTMSFGSHYFSLETVFFIDPSSVIIGISFCIVCNFSNFGIIKLNETGWFFDFDMMLTMSNRKPKIEGIIVSFDE